MNINDLQNEQLTFSNNVSSELKHPSKIFIFVISVQQFQILYGICCLRFFFFSGKNWKQKWWNEITCELLLLLYGITIAVSECISVS